MKKQNRICPGVEVAEPLSPQGVIAPPGLQETTAALPGSTGSPKTPARNPHCPSLSPTVLAQLCCPGASYAQSHGKTPLTCSQSPTGTRGAGTATASVPGCAGPPQRAAGKCPEQTSAGTVPAVTAGNQRKAATGSHLQPGHLCHCQLQLLPRQPAAITPSILLHY